MRIYWTVIEKQSQPGSRYARFTPGLLTLHSIIQAVECAFPYHIDKEVLKETKEKLGLEQVQ